MIHVVGNDNGTVSVCVWERGRTQEGAIRQPDEDTTTTTADTIESQRREAKLSFAKYLTSTERLGPTLPTQNHTQYTRTMTKRYAAHKNSPELGPDLWEQKE